MNNYFQDIVEKLGEPKWFDDNGYPRYCDFAPDEISNIYAREVAFLLITCQNCNTPFKVAVSSNGFNWHGGPHSYRQIILDHAIGYGDPPNMHCCSAGPSMTSNPVRVLEFWERYVDGVFEWVRNPIYEINVDDYEDEI
jgi:hypothetical protein